MTVYLDVLVLLNLYVCYFLFQGTARLLSIRIRPWRMGVGCLLGGLYSLSFMLESGLIFLILLKIAMAVSLVLLVFFTPHIGAFFKRLAVFLFVNVLYGGLMTTVWLFFAPTGMLYRNGVVYFDISALTLAIATVGAYLVILLMDFCRKRRAKPADLTTLTVGMAKETVTVTSFIDTGNRLSDPFSGLPVAVCEYGAVAKLLPDSLQSYCQDPFNAKDQPPGTVRLIPVRVLTGETVLPAFRPDVLLVNGQKRDGMVAVAPGPLSPGGSYHAILHTDLL